MKPTWWRRRWVRICTCLVSLVILCLLLAPLIARPIVRAKLEAAIREKWNAHVQIGRIGYWPPYSFSVRSFRVTATDGGQTSEVLFVKRLDLSLKKSPFASGPLQIDTITIDSPTVRLIRTADGLLGSKTNSAATKPSRRKLSEMLGLGHLEIRDAKLIYDDGTASSGAVPLVWQEVDVTATQTSPGNLSYKLTGRDDASAAISASGTADLDNLRLRLEECSMQVQCDPNAWQCAIPDQIQQLVRRYRIAGPIAISAKGETLLNSQALKQLNAEIHVSPQQITVQPDGFSAPLLDFSGTAIHVHGGSAKIDRIAARCEDDSLQLNGATVWLRDLPRAIAFDNLAGTLELGNRHATYPQPVADILARADVRGPFAFDGCARIDFSQPGSPALDYVMALKTDQGAMTLARHEITLENIALRATVTSRHAQIDQFSADALGGKLIGSGSAELHNPPSYSAQIRVQQVDLNQLAQVTAKPGKRITVSGLLSGAATFSGQGVGAAALDALQARGSVEATKGDLFHVAVLRDIVERIGLEKAASASEASSSFTVAQRKVHLTDASINSMVMGISGDGDVYFDGRLDLDVLVDVLSDWEDQIRRARNPLADVLGGVAGAVQKAFNKVTETLLYKLHVGGTVQKREIKVIGAPVLHRK